MGVEFVFVRGVSDLRGFGSAGYRWNWPWLWLKSRFTQGWKANDSKVLTTISEYTVAGFHSIYLVRQLTKELLGLPSTPHSWLVWYNHPFWSNLNDFDLLFSLWVSWERKFSINHHDVCFQLEWACLWLKFISYPGWRQWTENRSVKQEGRVAYTCQMFTLPV